MLTVITGLPGAGKTAMCVERFLMPLAAKGWEEEAITPDGEKIKVKRKLWTNISGLLLEHELIDADDLLKWHEWVKPGDLIVFDEVQKPWPLTGANKEQAKCITELETHRHYGIDMILLTQHPMLINSAIVRLAGQHLHVRRLGASRFATVYEWDGVSRTLLYKNSFAKKPWRRGKEVEKTYRSSSLHTKQKRAVPTVLYVIIAALVLFPVGFWWNAKQFKARFFGGDVASAVDKADAGRLAAAGAVPAIAAASAPVAPSAALAEEKKPVFSGCVASAARCTCYDTAMHQVERDEAYCRVQSTAASPPTISLDGLVIPEQDRHRLALVRASQADLELIASAAARGLEGTAQGTLGKPKLSSGLARP